MTECCHQIINTGVFIVTTTTDISASDSYLDFHALPSKIKAMVREDLSYQKMAYVKQQSRFFEENGFESESAYRLELFSNYILDKDMVESAIQATVVEQYQEHGKTEPWMVPVLNKYPQLLADSLKF